MPTRNIIGNAPEPHELYGRAELIGSVWHRITENNILLLGPRRFGKTGVLRHVLQVPRDGYRPVCFDLEDADSSEEFLWRLTRVLLSNVHTRKLLNGAASLPGMLREWIGDDFDETRFDSARVKFKKAAGKDWSDIARRLLLELEGMDATVIFILDELPAMLEKLQTKQGEGGARDFLAWFRTARLRQHRKLRPHRFIVADSGGSESILCHSIRAHELSDFERLYVQPLQDDAARRLIRDLAETMHVELDELLVNRILELIGPPVPYYIHMLFSQLGQLPSAHRQPLHIKTLAEVYRSRVRGPTCKHYFEHYRQRLRRYGKTAEKSAVAILSIVAERGRVSEEALRAVCRKTKHHSTSSVAFGDLLAHLERDWYLVRDPRTSTFYFGLDVMRDWWQRWHRTAKGRTS